MGRTKATPAPAGFNSGTAAPTGSNSNPPALPGSQPVIDPRPAPVGINQGQPAPGASSNPSALIRYRQFNTVIGECLAAHKAFRDAQQKALAASYDLEARLDLLAQLAPQLPVA